MPTEVILPRVDMDMATGKVSRWYVEEAGQVEKGKPLFEIETDKAAMEVEAPVSGTLRDIFSPEGVDLPVGSVVAWIYADGEAYPSAGAAAAVPALDVPTMADAVAELAVPEMPPLTSPAAVNGTKPNGSGEGSPRATPLSRRLAREQGIDLATVRGSGPRGRIQKGDLEYVAQPEQPPADYPSGIAARGIDSPVLRPGSESAGEQRPSTLNSVWLRHGEGAPVVLIHGFGADLNGWRPLLSGAQLSRPVLALDLPGHGKSDLLARISLDDFAAAVEETLLQAGIQSVDLVGHSLGGAVAARVAAGNCISVRSLFLLSPGGLGPDVNGVFLDGFTRARGEDSLYAWMRELVVDEAMLGPALVKATARARQDGALAAAQDKIARALFPDGTQAFSVRSLLARIDVPTKVVFGTADRIIPAHHAQGLPGAIALHIFSGIGHMPQLEAKAEVLRLLGELLRSAA